jgi:uncharacterized protein (TIGR02594 family)
LVEISAYDLAMRFAGIEEVPGHASNPQLLAMLQLDATWPADDEVAWCSAFVNYVAWLLRLPRSKALNARSWLAVGRPIDLNRAESDSDVVILRRGPDPQPGPEVLNAPGHVGFFAEYEPGTIWLLGGNQGNAVSLAPFSAGRVLGVRRLA